VNRGDMQRRGKSGQPVKGRHTNRPKARNAPTVYASSADLQEELDRRTRELDEALQQQTATSEVLNIIRRSPADAQPVFDAIVQSAARLCGAIFSVVYLYDGDRLRIAATHNFTPAATTQLNELQQLKRPDRSHLGGRAILNCAVVHVHDVLADPEYSHELALAGGWRAVLAVPLLRDGKPVGALTVAKAEPTPFSDRQVQLLNTFADQALIAIQNVRLFEAEQQRKRELSEALEQQTATSDVLRVVSSSPGDLEPVFTSMLENAVRVCDAKFGIIFRWEDDALVLVATHNTPPAFAEFRRRLPLRSHPQNAVGRAVATKRAVHVADLAAEQPLH
jgi:two-component system, NtrC family, sensor kinase